MRIDFSPVGILFGQFLYIILGSFFLEIEVKNLSKNQCSKGPVLFLSISGWPNHTSLLSSAQKRFFFLLQLFIVAFSLQI